MSTLDHKIDFAVILSVSKANPNGDPLNGNRPRQNYDGHGEISDVAIKRKIRNRLQDMGEPVFVQSDDRKVDSHKSLRERADSNPELAKMLKAKMHLLTILHKLLVRNGLMSAVLDKYLPLKGQTYLWAFVVLFQFILQQV